MLTKIRDTGFVTQLRLISFKNLVDKSKVPTLDDKDIECQFVRGSGPGGSGVNKSKNQVVMKHIPTNFVVKCHGSRSVHHNVLEAKKLLIKKLDNYYNGEDSIDNQIKRLEANENKKKEERRTQLEAMKAAFKERESLT